jgi:hypothetical protein
VFCRPSWQMADMLTIDLDPDGKLVMGIVGLKH